MNQFTVPHVTTSHLHVCAGAHQRGGKVAVRIQTIPRGDATARVASYRGSARAGSAFCIEIRLVPMDVEPAVYRPVLVSGGTGDVDYTELFVVRLFRTRPLKSYGLSVLSSVMSSCVFGGSHDTLTCETRFRVGL